LYCLKLYYFYFNFVIHFLYLSAMKSGYRSLEDLWKKDSIGAELFSNVMSKRRFRFIFHCIRFDDVRGRCEWQKIDKITHIWTIFEMFVSSCKKAYAQSEYICIDKKLQTFRGKCSFRQYIPSKPAKYWIKIFALCDN